jgi:hypothetical protein
MFPLLFCFIFYKNENRNFESFIFVDYIFFEKIVDQKCYFNSHFSFIFPF